MHHNFVPINIFRAPGIYLLSSDKADGGTKVSVTGLTGVAVETSQLCPRKYAAATYNSDWYTRCHRT
jgi:hypothetical protein